MTNVPSVVSTTACLFVICASVNGVVNFCGASGAAFAARRARAGGAARIGLVVSRAAATRPASRTTGRTSGLVVRVVDELGGMADVVDAGDQGDRQGCVDARGDEHGAAAQIIEDHEDERRHDVGG